MQFFIVTVRIGEDRYSHDLEAELSVPMDERTDTEALFRALAGRIVGYAGTQLADLAISWPERAPLADLAVNAAPDVSFHPQFNPIDPNPEGL